MNELTLEWQEAGYIKTQKIYDQQYSKNPGTVRIGRDPTRCDLVLNDPTVSGLHIEIVFNAVTNTFALRNLRETNPPLVDGRQIVTGEVPLAQGSVFYLGQLELRVVEISLHKPNSSIAPTILLSPQPSAATHQHPPAAIVYGLQCPKCHRISPYDRMDWGCQWCGTSLAAAASVLMSPNSSN